MSVATLIGGALKTRQAGAREAQTASVELPEKTACGRLADRLTQFQQACSDLDGYKAKAARAAIDEDRAMADEQLSETQAAETIAKARSLKDTYQARISNREKALTKLFGELENAIVEAQQEYRPLHMAELNRVEEILIERVCAGIKADPTTRALFEWDELLKFSEPYRAISDLRMVPYARVRGKLPWIEPEQKPAPELVEVWKIRSDGGMLTERVPAPINHDAPPEYSNEQIIGPARQTLEMYTRLEAQKREAF